MINFRKITDFLKKVGTNNNNTNTDSNNPSTAASPRATPADNNNNTNNVNVLQGLPNNATTQEVLRHVKKIVESRGNGLVMSNINNNNNNGGGSPMWMEEDRNSPYAQLSWNYNNNNADNNNNATNVGVLDKDVDSLIFLTKQYSTMGENNNNNNTIHTPLNKSLNNIGEENTNNNNNNTKVGAGNMVPIFPVTETTTTPPSHHEADLLQTLLAERTEMIELLDVCLQEIPAEGEEKETPAATSNNTSSTVPSVPPGDDVAVVPATAEVEGEKAASPAESFDIYQWRQLLLAILNHLVCVERALYIERSKNASVVRGQLEGMVEDLRRRESEDLTNNNNTTNGNYNDTIQGATSYSSTSFLNLTNTGASEPKAPLLTPEADVKNTKEGNPIVGDAPPSTTAAANNTNTNNDEAEKRQQHKKKEKELLQCLEDTLSAALSTATWVMLRNVIHQHLKKIENARYRSKIIADKSPSPDAAETTITTDTTKTTGVPSTTGRKPWQQDELIMVDWRVVVSEVKELLGFVEDNISQCIICAALIRDDGRELLSCMLQQPKPRYILQSLLGKSAREPMAPPPATTATPAVPVVKTCVTNRLANSTSSSGSSAGNTSGASSTSSSAGNSPKVVPGAAPLQPTSLVLGTPTSAPLSVAATPNKAAAIEEDVVLDDLLEHLQFIYTEGVSKTFQLYLEETLFSLDRLVDEDEESSNNNTTENPAVFSYNSFMQEDEEVGSATDRSSSHCSPSRVSRQEGRPSAGERPTIKTNPLPGVTSPTPAEEEKRPLPSIITQLNDPRMFCQLATAFFFCSDSWSSSSRMNLFQSLSEGIGAHMVREIVPGKRSKANTAQVSRAATPASGVMAPSSPASGKAAAAPIAPAQKTQLSPTTTITNVTSQPLNTWRSATTPNNTTNNGSRSHTPINNVVGTPVLGATPSNTEGDFKVLQHSHSNVSSTFTVPRQDSANPLNSAMVAAMYREAFNKINWPEKEDDDDDVTETIASLPVLLRDMLERIVNMSWSAALHKHAQHCVSARPPLLSEAQECAKQERKAAAMYNDFRAKQRALSSLVSAQLASGKSHEALVIAKKHFNNEKKEWASKSQSMFSALQYLQSMKMLVQTLSACRSYRAVIETVQLVLPQAALCEQMLEVLCPKPRGSFIVRFGECRFKLLQTRVYLAKECWRAYYVTDSNSEKTEKYFNEHITYLRRVRRFQREAELYEAYMERGSQLLFRGQYGKAVDLFGKAVGISKSALEAADAKYNRNHSALSTPSSVAAGSPSVGSAFAKEGSTAVKTNTSFFSNAHLRGAGSGSLTSAEEHVDNSIHHNREKLELPWRLAESQRMLALAYVTQAEHEVNVIRRKTELSNAVNNAYASQTSLQRWQSKGGTPKRMLTAVPCSLFVTCKALLLLKQARKAVLLLEPLIEEKSNSAQIRPPMWSELFHPTEEPLTAEDIVLRVNVSIVKIAVYQLYVKCISQYDGEKALNAEEHVTRLLQEEEEWITAVAVGVREQHSSHSEPLVLDNKNKEALQLSHEQQQQQDDSKNNTTTAEENNGGNNSVTDSQPALDVKSDILSGELNVTQESNFALATPSSGNLNNANPLPAQNHSSVVSDGRSGQESPVPTDGGTFGGTSVTSVNPVAVVKEVVSPQEVDAKDLANTNQEVLPELVPVEPTIRVIIESKSERLTALHALHLAKKEVRKAHRDLLITQGDAFFYLQRLDEALESYSSALLINEEESTNNSNLHDKAARSGSGSGGIPLHETFEDDDDDALNTISNVDILAVVAHDYRADSEVHENVILGKLADVYKALQKPNMAIHYNELVVGYSRQNKDDLLEYRSMLQLARIYTQWNLQPAEAQVLWEKVSTLAKKYDDSEVSRETMRNIINGQEAAGAYVDVVSTAQDLKKLTDDTEDSEGSADRRFALESLARAHLHLAQYDKCLEALTQREQEQERANEWSGQVLEMTAKALLGTGEKEKALQVLHRWVAKAHTMQLWFELGNANKALAAAHAGNNDIHEARDRHDAALRAFERVLVPRSDSRHSLLDSVRWLVHYYFSNEEPVLVDKSIKQKLPEAGGGGRSQNDSTLQSFDHNLHNNSGDLGAILEADEVLRASQNKDDDEDVFFNGSFHSFSGSAEAMLSDDTPFESDEGSPQSPESEEMPEEDIVAEEPAEEKRDDGVLVAYEEVKPKPKLFLDSFDKANLASEKDLLPLLINANKKEGDSAKEKPASSAAKQSPKGTGMPVPTVKGLQPPSTSIANVSLCNKPAAPAEGDVLDKRSISDTTSTAATAEEETADAMTDKPPSKVRTTCHRNAIVYMEWSNQVIQSFNAVSRYVSIPYSPAEAVDMALLSHRDCTFVFYFAEYTTSSSSCYDVIIRPAGYEYFWAQRSAQVTTLSKYHERKWSDFEGKGNSNKTRAELAQAVFGDGEVAKDKEKEKEKEVPVAPPIELLQKDTLQHLYDVYDELWSPVNSVFRLYERQQLTDAQAVFIVPDTTLLHTPFPALLPNPDMCRPGEDTRPLGARLPLVVTPSLTHIALFTTAEMDPVDEFKNVVFLPDSLSAPAPLQQRTSTNTPPEAANAPPQRTATTSSTGFISLASGNGLSAMNNPEVSHPSPSTEATSGKPTGVTSSMGNSNVDLTNTKGVLGSSTNGAISSAVSVASSSRANIAPTDPFSVLTPFWEIHHGSTRKELMTCITDPRIKGFMLLTTPKRNGSSVGDGSVSAYDIINIGNKTYASANNSGNSAGAGEGGHARRDGGPGSKSSKTKKNTTTEFAQASFLVQTRNNLELMVLASDRSEQTTADSLGAAALFCSQLQCKRVLRVDLAPGEPLNHYHKEFIVRFLKYVESSYTVQTSLAFATALHCVMQEFYDTYGEEHLEWAAFTLVGMP